MNNQLAELRAEIELLTAELTATERTPLPMADAIASLRVDINWHKARFEERIAHMATSVAFETGRGRYFEYPGELAFAWLAHAHGEALLADIEHRAAEIRKQEGLHPMTKEDRQARMDSIRQQRYALWLQEEVLVTSTGATRRPDANTAAVLGIPFDIAQKLGALS